MTDPEVKDAVARSQAGDESARSDFALWVHDIGMAYYVSLYSSRKLHGSTPETMAAELVEAMLGKLDELLPETAHRYVKRSMKMNHMQNEVKWRRRREHLKYRPHIYDSPDLDPLFFGEPDEPPCTDEDLLRLRAVQNVYERTQPDDRIVIIARLHDDPVPYTQILQRHGIDLGPQRLARFKKKCEAEYQHLKAIAA